MGEAGITGLIERFADLPDSRVEGRTDHDLLDIVVLALCAVMSGAEGWDDIEDWGREREAWLRRYLRLRNGIPGHDTIRRVFEALSPLALEQRSTEVWKILGGVKTEFARFGEVLEKTRRKLQEASSSIESAEVRTRAMARQLRSVEGLTDERPPGDRAED